MKHKGKFVFVLLICIQKSSMTLTHHERDLAMNARALLPLYILFYFHYYSKNRYNALILK